MEEKAIRLTMEVIILMIVIAIAIILGSMGQSASTTIYSKFEKVHQFGSIKIDDQGEIQIGAKCIKIGDKYHYTLNFIADLYHDKQKNIRVVPVMIFKGSVFRGDGSLDIATLSGETQKIQITYFTEVQVPAYTNPDYLPFIGENLSITFWDDACLKMFGFAQGRLGKDQNKDSFELYPNLTKQCGGSFQGQIDYVIKYIPASCQQSSYSESNMPDCTLGSSNASRCNYISDIRGLLKQRGCYFSSGGTTGTGLCTDCGTIYPNPEECDTTGASNGKWYCTNCMRQCEWSNGKCQSTLIYHRDFSCANCYYADYYADYLVPGIPDYQRCTQYECETILGTFFVKGGCRYENGMCYPKIPE